MFIASISKGFLSSDVLEKNTLDIMWKINDTEARQQ
jgi:hypothetical protein